MRAVLWCSASAVLALLLGPRAHAQPEPEQTPAPETTPAEPPPAPEAASEPADGGVAAPEVTAEPGADPTATDAETSADARSATGGDIIVTAQKREDKLIDVPISVSVVSSESLKASAAKNLTELQGVTPGVYFSGNTSYGGAPMAIRGTAGSNSALLDDPVAVYLDGVYMPSGTFASSTLLDIASLEVARGPQGTLQGRNATAGAVLVRSADPKFAPEAYLRGSIAQPLEYRLEGAASGAILDSLAARIAVGYAKEEGWADNTFDGTKLGSSESLLGRLVLLFRPTERLRLRLTTSYSVVEAEPALARWAATPFSADPAGPLIVMGTATPTTPLTPAEKAQIEDGNFALNRPADSRTDTFFNALEASYAFEGVDLISVTGFIYTDTDGYNDSDGLARTDREGFNRGLFESTSFSEELRLQSNGTGPLSWIVGGYYSFSPSKMDFRINNLAFTAPDRRYTRFIADQDSASYAAFADATLDFLEQFSVTAGLRYTYEERAFEFDSAARNFDTDVVLDMPPPVMYRPEEAGWDDVSFRGKLTYAPIEAMLLYASFAKGFKSGGFNAFGSDNAFDPEYLWSAELGAKTEFPERRGWVAASVYVNRYDDLQVRAGVPSGGVAIINAADSSIEGFEVEGQAALFAGLSLQGNVAYTHARFDSFPAAVDLLGPMVDAKGNRLPRTPDWQFFAQATYDLQLATDWAARAQVSYRWRDTLYYYQTNQDSPALQGEPLGELGARVSLYYDRIDLSFALFGTNLTNDRSVNGFSPNFNYPEVSFNKPRVVGLEVEKKF